jgi:shikimate kinase
MKNIILIGFMGVGKGTVARALAKDSDLFTIDTDDLIESLENCKIKQIFEKEGEAYFRSLEQKTAYWLEKSVKNAIISTGGGFFKVKNIRDIGTIVLLDSSFEKILQRIKEHPNATKKLAKRPLFKSPQKAKEIYQEREKAYKKIADFIINVEDKTEKEVVAKIRKKLKF